MAYIYYFNYAIVYIEINVLHIECKTAFLLIKEQSHTFDFNIGI